MRAALLLVLVLAITATGLPTVSDASTPEEQASEAAAPAAGGYVGLSPARILSTRQGIGSQGGAVPPRGTIHLQVAGQGGVPADGVAAVALTVAVAGSQRHGYLTVHPHGAARPNTSSLNYATGQTTGNLVMAKLGDDGKVAIYNGSAGTVHVYADVAGYVTDAVSGPLMIMTSDLGSARVGEAFGAALHAEGGSPPYTWEVTDLPAGLQADRAGLVTGSPVAVGDANPRVAVTDARGETATATMPLPVEESDLPPECQVQACAVLEPAPGTVELDATRVRGIEYDEMGSITRVTVTAPPPAIGAQFLVAASGEGQAGTVVAVDGIHANADGTATLDVTTTGLGQAYRSGVVNAVGGEIEIVPPASGGSSPASAAESSPRAGGMPEPLALEQRVTAEARCGSEGEHDVRADLSGGVAPDMEVVWDHTGVRRVQAFTEFHLALSVEAEVSGTYRCEIATHGWRIIAPTPVTGVAAVFVFEPTLAFDVTAQANARVSVGIRCISVFGYRAGTTPVFACSDQDQSVETSFTQPAIAANLYARMRSRITVSDVVGLTGTLTVGVHGAFSTLPPAASLALSGAAEIGGCLACWRGGDAIHATFLEYRFGPRQFWAIEAAPPPPPGTPPAPGSVQGRIVRLPEGTLFYVDTTGWKHPLGPDLIGCHGGFSNVVNVEGAFALSVRMAPTGEPAACFTGQVGDIIRHPDGDAYVLSGVASAPVRRWIPTGGTYACERARGRRVVGVTRYHVEELTSGADLPRGNCMVRGPGGDAQFINNEGLREWVPDAPTYDCEVGRGIPVMNVSAEFIDSIDETGWHYCLHKPSMHGKVLRHDETDAHYIHPDNTRTWIPDAPTWECRMRQGKVVVETRWREYVEAFTPTGWDYCFDAALFHGRVLRHHAGDGHYIHPDGTRTWIPDGPTWDCRMRQGKEVVDTRWREYVDRFRETGWDYCFDIETFKGRIITHPAGDSHYVDTAGRRHWIPTEGVYWCLRNRGVPATEVRWREYIDRISEGPHMTC